MRADVSSRNPEGNTPLVVAAQINNSPAAQALLASKSLRTALKGEKGQSWTHWGNNLVEVARRQSPLGLVGQPKDAQRAHKIAIENQLTYWTENQGTEKNPYKETLEHFGIHRRNEQQKLIEQQALYEMRTNPNSSLNRRLAISQLLGENASPEEGKQEG